MGECRLVPGVFFYLAMCLECADRLVIDFLGRVKINAGIGDGPIKWIYISRSMCPFLSIYLHGGLILWDIGLVLLFVYYYFGYKQMG